MYIIWSWTACNSERTETKWKEMFGGKCLKLRWRGNNAHVCQYVACKLTAKNPSDMPHQERLIPRLETNLKSFYGEDPQKSDGLGRVINERHFGWELGEQQFYTFVLIVISVIAGIVRQVNAQLIIKSTGKYVIHVFEYHTIIVQLIYDLLRLCSIWKFIFFIVMNGLSLLNNKIFEDYLYLKHAYLPTPNLTFQYRTSLTTLK